MQKKNEKCVKIYNENKELVYWFLSKKCPWLLEEEVYDIMLNVWRILSSGVDEVCNLRSEYLQSKWLIELAYVQAVKYNEDEEVNERK